MRRLLKIAGQGLQLAVGTLVAIHVLLLAVMIAGAIVALVGGIAGVTWLRDVGGVLAGGGALGFVGVLVCASYVNEFVDIFSTARGDQKAPLAQPAAEERGEQ